MKAYDNHLCFKCARTECSGNGHLDGMLGPTIRCPEWKPDNFWAFYWPHILVLVLLVVSIIGAVCSVALVERIGG